MKSYEEVLKIKNKYEEEIFKYPNVVGVGIGSKHVGGKKVSDDFCILVLVRVKTKDLDNPDTMIPESFEDVLTDVLESGEIGPQVLGRVTNREKRTDTVPVDLVNTQRKRFNTLIGGISGLCNINNLNKVGTLGCTLLDKNNKKVMLSNWHVLYAKFPSKNKAIMQPSPGDGGDRNKDLFGDGEDYRISATFDPKYDPNYLMDAATANISPLSQYARPVLNWIYGIGRVMGQVDGKKGMMVQKTGRTTGTTQGTIDGTDVTLKHFVGLEPSVAFHFSNAAFKNSEAMTMCIYKDNIYMTFQDSLYRINPNDGSSAKISNDNWRGTKAWCMIGDTAYVVQGQTLNRVTDLETNNVKRVDISPHRTLLDVLIYTSTIAMIVHKGTLLIASGAPNIFQITNLSSANVTLKSVSSKNWKGTRTMFKIHDSDDYFFVIQDSRLWIVYGTFSSWAILDGPNDVYKYALSAIVDSESEVAYIESQNSIYKIDSIKSGSQIVLEDVTNYEVPSPSPATAVLTNRMVYYKGQVFYPGKEYLTYIPVGARCIFKNNFMVNKPIANAFSLGGDSGSVVLDMNNNLVGLLFAGTPVTKSTTAVQSFFVKISDVLSTLNLKLPNPIPDTFDKSGTSSFLDSGSGVYGVSSAIKVDQGHSSLYLSGMSGLYIHSLVDGASHYLDNSGSFFQCGITIIKNKLYGLTISFRPSKGGAVMYVRDLIKNTNAPFMPNVVWSQWLSMTSDGEKNLYVLGSYGQDVKVYLYKFDTTQPKKPPVRVTQQDWGLGYLAEMSMCFVKKDLGSNYDRIYLVKSVKSVKSGSSSPAKLFYIKNPELGPKAVVVDAGVLFKNNLTIGPMTVGTIKNFPPPTRHLYLNYGKSIYKSTDIDSTQKIQFTQISDPSEDWSNTHSISFVEDPTINKLYIITKGNDKMYIMEP